MKHKIKVRVKVEERGLFGVKKTRFKEKTVWVDSKTYRKIQSERKERALLIDELAIYDAIFDDE